MILYKIAISGYSAGASVCSMSATQWMDPVIVEKLGAPSQSYKPDAVILAYGCNDLSTIFDVPPSDDLVIPTPGKITADRTPQVDVVNYVSKDTAPIFSIIAGMMNMFLLKTPGCSQKKWMS